MLHRFLFPLIALVALSPPFLCAQSKVSGTIPSTGGGASCVSINVDAQSTVGIQVTGTWTGTLQPEISIQGQAAQNIQVTPSTSSTAQSTVTANGVYRARVAGGSTFLLCGNTVASGTANVYLNTTTAVSLDGIGSGGVPSGSAGGDLGSTYPNPTVVSVAHVTAGTLAPANGGVASCSTVGLCGEFAGFDSIPNSGLTLGSAQIVSAANITDCYAFTLKSAVTVGHLGIRVTTTFGAASHIGVAIYDSTKTRTAATTGALDGTNIAGVQIAAVSAQLNPGQYYLCASSDGATTGRMYNLNIQPSVGGLTQFVNNTNGNRVVTGSVASVGGVPPATLGTLSADAAAVNPPVLYMEP